MSSSPDGVVPRPLPLPDVLEDGAVGDVPGVDGRRAHGIGEHAAIAAGEQREGDGDGRRPVRRRAQLRHPDAEQPGQHAEREHAGGAALVVGGPDRREALDVLGRAHPRADRPAQVGDDGVALEVEVVPAPALAVLGLDGEERERRPPAGARRGRDVTVADRGEAGRLRGLGAGGDARGDAGAGVARAGRRAHDRPALGRRVGEEGGRGIVPAQGALGLRPQLERRVPAARDREQVAGDGAHAAVLADPHGGQRRPALRPADQRAVARVGDQRDRRSRRRRAPRPTRARSRRW